MEIYRYSEKKDLCKIKELLKTSITSNHLIPILGAGFSAGTKTMYGNVPDVNQLKEQMVFLLLQTSEYNTKRKEDLLKIDLSTLASAFWRAISREENQKIGDKFNDYIETNFTKVRDLPMTKRKFLNSGWRYIYTLNYDDSVEQNLDIYTVIPYQPQSRKFIDSHNCLFKLHGDANAYIKTDDKRYCVLSNQQYIDSMKAQENDDMCKHLEGDFASNSLLFIGCGLKNELDLLFAADMGLAQKTVLSKDESNIIYV